MTTNNNAEQKSWSLDTIGEIINDLFCFETILRTKSYISNIELKSYFSMFLKTVVPVYIYEIANSLEKFNIVAKDDFFNSGMKKKVTEERQKSLKRVVFNSSQAQKAVEKMGLSFSEKVYDMNIILNEHKLIDMNFELYVDDIKEDDFDFWDSLYSLPNAILKAFVLAFNATFDIEQIFDYFNDELKSVVQNAESENRLERYSYSAYKLFKDSDSLELVDKIFILFRFRLISSVDLIEKLFPSIGIKADNEFVIDIKRFFRKYKALIICLVGEDLKGMNSEFSKTINNWFKINIDESFWRLNRSLRNNLHYESTNILSEKELDLVDRFQNIYLEYLINNFERQINIDIDEECITMTSFLEACCDKGLDKDKIFKNYAYLYRKFYLTGKI